MAIVCVVRGMIGCGLAFSNPVAISAKILKSSEVFHIGNFDIFILW
jgi:hypothetical protein